MVYFSFYVNYEEIQEHILLYRFIKLRSLLFFQIMYIFLCTRLFQANSHVCVHYARFMSYISKIFSRDIYQFYCMLD